MIYFLSITTLLFFVLYVREKYFGKDKNSQVERLNRTAERIYIFWFWLIVSIVIYDSILNDFITNQFNIDTSPISDNTISLIKHGFIYFVAPMIFKILKDSIPEFVQFAGAISQMTNSIKPEISEIHENENSKKYQE